MDYKDKLEGFIEWLHHIGIAILCFVFGHNYTLGTVTYYQDANGFRHVIKYSTCERCMKIRHDK